MTPPPSPSAPPPADDAEFGPGGYLPQRAAQRARKIVLREQMGVHWPIAAVVAGVLTLAITVPLVLSSTGAPDPPFVDAGPLAAIDPAGDGLVDVDGTEVLVVRGGGVLRAFADPPDGARWCPTSRRVEAPDGRVWTAQGRLIAGDGESLQPAAVTAYEGALYIDPAGGSDALPPNPGTQTPAC
ncbi:hypothetical protein [Euzebya sp.]|uniref:hypothetical protein n=1 Tax=Euzebya sp. TaxID=1971409 RepID=UPI0035141B8E